MLQDHPNRPVPNLFRLPLCRVHDPVISNDEVSVDAGAVHQGASPITIHHSPHRDNHLVPSEYPIAHDGVSSSISSRRRNRLYSNANSKN